MAVSWIIDTAQGMSCYGIQSNYKHLWSSLMTDQQKFVGLQCMHNIVLHTCMFDSTLANGFVQLVEIINMVIIQLI